MAALARFRKIPAIQLSTPKRSSPLSIAIFHKLRLALDFAGFQVFAPLLAVMDILVLSGCDNAARPVQAAGAAGREDQPAMAQGLRQPALPAPDANPGTDASAEARTLFGEVKRLHAACGSAGGGVSGSPDCDLATAREDELEGLGYCIDYPYDEMLVRCPVPSGAEDKERSEP